MPTDLPIECSCGALQGFVRDVSPETVNRCVCHCDDCQSFIHFLECEDRVLDRHGGTDLIQTSSARIKFTEGVEHLSCIRLSDKGLMRWYASCCMSPIASILPLRQIPFVSIVSDRAVPPPNGPSTEDVLGPIQARVNARFAKGNRDELDAHDRAPLSQIFRLISMLAKARLKGDHAHSPFFDPSTHQPIEEPHILTPEELKTVESTRDHP
jgi:hypothetical protein